MHFPNRNPLSSHAIGSRSAHRPQPSQIVNGELWSEAQKVATGLPAGESARRQGDRRQAAVGCCQWAVGSCRLEVAGWRLPVAGCSCACSRVVLRPRVCFLRPRSGRNGRAKPGVHVLFSCCDRCVVASSSTPHHSHEYYSCRGCYLSKEDYSGR